MVDLIKTAGMQEFCREPEKGANYNHLFNGANLTEWMQMGFIYG